MPLQEFHFEMTLSGGASGEVVPMMADIVRSALAQVGLDGEAAERLLDELRAAREASPGACRLRFAARAGRLEIALLQAGGDWRTSCPILIR